MWDQDEPDVPLNVWLAEEGHVDIYEEAFGDVLLRSELEIARDRARSRGLGLWGACQGG